MRRPNLVVLFSSALAAACWMASTAAAQLAATELEPGGFYFDVQGNGRYVKLPETKGFYFLGLGPVPNIPINGEDSAWGGGAEGGVGWVLPEDRNVIGRNLRIEVVGHWFDADERAGTIPFSNQSFALIGIDGSFSFTSPSTSGSIRTVLDYNAQGADLLLRTDFGEEGSVRVSPFLGFTYTRVNRDEVATTTVLLNTTRHNLETDYIGGALGAVASLPLGWAPALILSMEGRADLMVADADLDAASTIGLVQVKDSESNFAARVGGSVVLSWLFGPVVVGIEGFGHWLSWSPQAVYPSLLPPRSPVHIEGDDAWDAGGGLRITIPF